MAKIGAKELASRALRERNYEAAQKSAKTSWGGAKGRAIAVTATLSKKDSSAKAEAGIKPGSRETVPVRWISLDEAKKIFPPSPTRNPKRGPPRIEDRDKTLTATKPWETAVPKMSRRTWYRRQAEKRQ